MTTARLSEDSTSLERYPYTVDNLREDHPGLMVALPLDADTMKHFRMVVVQASQAPTVSVSQEVKEVDPRLVDGEWVQQWTVVDLPKEVLDDRRLGMTVLIDEACASIYTRVGRFADEYKDREAQAIAFKEAGYSGETPRAVAAFSISAGVSATYATNVILSQAALLREALAKLGELRMKKYLVKGLPFDQAVDQFNEVIQAITAVGKSL